MRMSRSRRFVLLLALVAVVAVTPAVAQFRGDIGVLIPWRIGAVLNGIEGESSESLDILEFATLPIPELMLSYSGDLGIVTVGGGLRGLSVILQSLFWPAIYAEAELGPAVVHFNLGGGAFWTFGLAGSYLETGRVFIPDLSAYLKIGKSFRLGLGGAAITGLVAGEDVRPWVFYISGKFVTQF